MMSKGSLFIVSAPSGAGKTTLLKALQDRIQNLHVSVSYTTRAMRDHEKEGIDYHFISSDTFQTLLKDGIFLEHAEVFGNGYGTSSQEVEQARLKGLDVVLEIDWQGARQVRAVFKDAHSIFILPPSVASLEARLQKRHRGEAALIEHRMQQARSQLSHYIEYDYLVWNQDFEVAVSDLHAIIQAHRLQSARAQSTHADWLKRVLG